MTEPLTDVVISGRLRRPRPSRDRSPTSPAPRAAGILLVVGIAARCGRHPATSEPSCAPRTRSTRSRRAGRSQATTDVQMAVTLVLVLVLALVLAALVLTGPVATGRLGIGVGDTAVTDLGHRQVAGVARGVLFMIALLYFAAPNAKLRGFKWVTPGSVLADRGLAAGVRWFAFYVANFGSYSKTYGALGGVIVPGLALADQRRDPARRGAQRRARAQPRARRGRAGAEPSPARPPLRAEGEAPRPDGLTLWPTDQPHLTAEGPGSVMGYAGVMRLET